MLNITVFLLSKMFHGLSSPNELKTAWFNMTEGQGLPELFVIWEFNEDSLNEFLKNENEKCVVVNSLYKQNPNMVGHYVAIYKTKSEVIYFDPLATFPQKWVIDEFFKFFDATQSGNVSHSIVVDLDGAQSINGNSCGYRCLFKLLKYCLGYQPLNYAVLTDNANNPEDLGTRRVLWNISKDNQKKFIDTTIKKTKREFKIIKGYDSIPRQSRFEQSV